MVRRASWLLMVSVLLAGSLSGPASASALGPSAHACPADLSGWKALLGAEWLACVRVADLTTTGNPYTDPNTL